MTFAANVQSIDSAVQTHLDGSTVSYAPSVGGPVALAGMFDANYVQVDASDPDVSSVSPAVFIDKANVDKLSVHPDDDDPKLTINGVVYVIRESKPDGMGGLLLLLHLAVV